MSVHESSPHLEVAPHEQDEKERGSDEGRQDAERDFPGQQGPGHIVAEENETPAEEHGARQRPLGVSAHRPGG